MLCFCNCKICTIKLNTATSLLIFFIFWTSSNIFMAFHRLLAHLALWCTSGVFAATTLSRCGRNYKENNK